MLAGGTSNDGCGRCTGQDTSGYMPGASFRSGFFTSSSTAIVRVLGSRSWATKLMTPENAVPGYAGTVNGTRAPFTMAPTSASGTATTRRSRDTWWSRNNGVL